VRQQFVKKATEVSGHEIRVEGEVRLVIGFYPILVVDRLHIANNPGWSTDDILSVTEARIQLALLPIFTGKLEFVEISASGVQVNLEQAANGSQNWALLLDSQGHNEQTQNSAANETGKSRNASREINNVWVEEFSLFDISINYVDETLKRNFTNKIDKLVLNTLDRTRLTASIEGNTQEIPYSFSSSSDLLRNLIANKPWQMTLQGQVADEPVNFEIHLNPADKTMMGTMRADVQKIDIGKTLSWLGIVEGLDAYSNELTLKAEIQGNNLKEILERSDFRVELSEGFWRLHSPANESRQKIIISSALLTAKQGQPVTLDFNGKIDDENVQLEISSNKLSEFFSTPDKIHLDIDAKLPHSTIHLDGNIDVPVSSQTFRTSLVIQGKRLDSWNKMLKQEMPPFGPYTLSGNFSVDAEGFRVSELKTTIGGSDLGGEIYIHSKGKKTHWELNLVSQTFQIDDFDVAGFSLVPGVARDDNRATTPAKGDSQQEPTLDAINDDLLKSNEYPYIDVDLQLDARNVMSGNYALGKGSINLQASENFLSIDKLHLDLPGGFMDGALEIQLHENNLSGHLKLDMDKFNYGVLYRHFYPDSVADGYISTRIDLQLAGRDFKHALEHGSGRLDYAFWPKNIEAKVLNIWSVNLFLAILPELKKKESKFNCAVALLDVEDGKLFEELLLLDTSKIWMNGNLNVNFQSEEVKLSLFPKAKKARLFGLQAPIRVKGNFSELGLSIKAYDILASYVKFITSPLHAPLKRLFGKNIPQDASELCEQFLDRDYVKSVVDEMKKESPTLDEMYNNE
ncbi:MAG: AsmA family protein, partial [Gammaproteobacteria bacterium]|nr:AsmA family protein [Gammaproteobacteria bacterium]MDX2486694.1 AsmA family protein [Gammaproteobacteria bacterium]